MRVASLLAALVLLVFALPAAGQPADNDDPDSFLGDWWVVHNDPEYGAFWGMQIEVTKVDDDTYTGIYRGGANLECVEPGDIVWSMTVGGTFGAAFEGEAHGLDCEDRPANWFVTSQDILRWNHLDDDEVGHQIFADLIREAPTGDPDAILGSWALDRDDALAGTVIQITGGPLEFEGRVTQAPEHDCLEVGQQVMDLRFESGDGQPQTVLLDYGGTVRSPSTCQDLPDREAELDLSADPDTLNRSPLGPMVRTDAPPTDPPTEQPDRTDDPEAPEEPDEPEPDVTSVATSFLQRRLAPNYRVRGAGPNARLAVRWIGEERRVAELVWTGPETECEEPGEVIAAFYDAEEGVEVFGKPIGPVTLEPRDDSPFAEGEEICEVLRYQGDYRWGDGSPADTVELRWSHRDYDATYVDVLDAEPFGLTRADGSAPQRVGAFFIQSILGDALQALPGFAGDAGYTLHLATQADFPDGLAVAGLAGATQGVTLLVDPDNPTINLAMLEALDPQPASIVVVGGTAVVPDSALPGVAYTRIAGTNRFHTAQVIAQHGWPGTSEVVYVATGANFPDALAGGAAAAFEGAPVLLVDGDRLPAETEAALTRLQPQRIVVLGGTAVIPDTMVQTLGGFADQVERQAGPTRVDTAIAIAEASFPDGAGTVMVTSGDTFGDALIAASASWLLDAPLLLSSAATLPDQVVAAIDGLGAGDVVSLSTDGALTETVLVALDAALRP